jgi:3-oxoacyl-[acyl-carrier protein] reductase
MEIRFDDQVVLITGASSGIGAALARGFGAAGARVVVHYHSGEANAQAVAREIEAAGGRAYVVGADVGDAQQCERLVDAALAHYGQIDVLINNAGAMFERALIHETSDDSYQRIMASAFYLCRRVIPSMLARGRGNIINMSSISARRGGGGGSVIYGAAKAAVATFTRGLAKELAAHNIRVNALSPGLILTPLHGTSTDPSRLQATIASIPMGRAGQPEECVGAAFFLASDALSSYVTGQMIEINGGLLMP